MFIDDFISKLKAAEDGYAHSITTHIVERDEYVRKLGYLQALREMKQELLILRKQYFPDIEGSL